MAVNVLKLPKNHYNTKQLLKLCTCTRLEIVKSLPVYSSGKSYILSLFVQDGLSPCTLEYMGILITQFIKLTISKRMRM